ncbi:MAG: gamma-glutamylcyclotransferase [Gammaproteobacteria bacterium]|nr:gamma-glutamylcyclotransferase [Gammaproteobacteria bacterium]NND37704.1 gamma-glutamylcyclotransferase [Gammaproteobacteria bacterium]
MPLLFSYGTLQSESVQLATFGRLLRGHDDELVGFETGLVSIEDSSVVGATGVTHYANVRFNGNDESRVSGTVFGITDGELHKADQYERGASYERRRVTLASGQDAWVYLHASEEPKT